MEAIEQEVAVEVTLEAETEPGQRPDGEGKDDSSKLPRPKEQFCCPICKRMFCSNHSRSYHLTKVHGIELETPQQVGADQLLAIVPVLQSFPAVLMVANPVVPSTGNATLGAKNTYNCDICDKTFNGPNTLTSHYMSTSHKLMVKAVKMASTPQFRPILPARSMLNVHSQPTPPTKDLEREKSETHRNEPAPPVLMTCSVCGRNYGCKKALNKHVAMKHRVIGEVPPSMGMGQMDNLSFFTELLGGEGNIATSVGKAVPSARWTCPVCGKIYGYRKTLNMHIREKHKMVKKSLPNMSTNPVSSLPPASECVEGEGEANAGPGNTAHLVKKLSLCPFNCGNNPCNHVNLRYLVPPAARKMSAIKCPLDGCNLPVPSNVDLRNHLLFSHKVTCEMDTLEFPSVEEFQKWKDQEEVKSLASFSKSKGCAVQKNFKKYRYSCHRSGAYLSHSHGKRRIRSQGSCKMGGTCPASMDIKEFSDGKIIVQYYRTHVGHKNNLAYLRLSAQERIEIARKIHQGVPLTRILNEMREKISCQRGIRNVKNIIKKKTIYNIRKSLHQQKEKWLSTFLDTDCEVDVERNLHPLVEQEEKEEEDYLIRSHMNAILGSLKEQPLEALLKIRMGLDSLMTIAFPSSSSDIPVLGEANEEPPSKKARLQRSPHLDKKTHYQSVKSRNKHRDLGMQKPNTKENVLKELVVCQEGKLNVNAEPSDHNYCFTA